MIDEEEYIDIAAENERLRTKITKLETEISDDKRAFSLNLALIEKQAFRIASLEAALSAAEENRGGWKAEAQKQSREVINLYGKISHQNDRIIALEKMLEGKE